MNESLISPSDHWTLWAVLLSTAAFGLWAERTRIGARLSGAIICILVTLILSNLGILPVSAPTYDVVWSFLVPLAVPLLLFRADLVRIIREAGPTLIGFAFGAVGTVIGTVVAFHLFQLGEAGWQLAGIFCATYVGGSMNFAAVSEAVELHSGDLLTAGVAADNLLMAIFLIILFAIPSIGFISRWYPKREAADQEDSDSEDIAGYWEKRELRLLDTAGALALATILCAVGYGLASWLNLKGGGILFVTALVVVLATAAPSRMSRLSGGEVIGTLLMHVFFAAIGASAHIPTVLRVGPVLFFFAGVILTIHLVFLLGAAKLFRLDIREAVIASNANLGGPTTAAAMAVARRWDALVIPAILCGTLGYAIATFIGVAVANWLH